MKRIAVKLTLLLLISAMVLSVLVACKNDKTGNIATDDGAKESQTAGGDGIAPLEKRDLGGKTFNVLLRTEYKDEFAIYEETNTSVPDAVYSRNKRVEEEYGVAFNFTDVVNDWDHRDTFTNAVHNSVLMGGDTAFDFVIGAQSYVAFNIALHDFLNLYDVPNLTFAGDWWGQQAVEALTINNVCYQATGDFAVSMLESMNCMYFNKFLAEQQNLPDLYDLARRKQWTHEKMVELSRDVYTDNGNTGFDLADSFGLMIYQTDIRSAIVVYDTPTLTKEGKIVWNTAHTQNVVEAIVKAFGGSQDGIYYCEGIDEAQNSFFNGRAMLLWGRLDSAAVLRNMEQDFGIIPCPMFTADQGEYYTTSNDASMVCVPTTDKDPDDIGFVIEAMCRESTDTVARVFYEKALKSKYAPDPQSSEMIELIRKSLTYDFGWVYSTQTGVSGNQYQIMMNEGSTNFGGWYKGQETVIKGKLKDFYALFGVTLEN